MGIWISGGAFGCTVAGSTVCESGAPTLRANNLGEVFNAAASAGIARALGVLSPFSHFQMVTEETPALLANPRTESPRSMRRPRSF